MPAFCAGFVRNAASRPAPSREFGGRVGHMVDGSPPGFARRVRKAPAMLVHCRLSGADRGKFPSCRVSRPSGVFRTRWSLLTPTVCAGALRTRRANRDGDPSTMDPTPPRTLAMVQGVTRHFEQHQRRRRAPLATGARYPLYPLTYPLLV